QRLRGRLLWLTFLGETRKVSSRRSTTGQRSSMCNESRNLNEARQTTYKTQNELRATAQLTTQAISPDQRRNAATSSISRDTGNFLA
ncbi:MAG: hypothetical protein KGM99_18295, partial [Burkholderiales bacterium]|nr:hypothetical protein [Burkholderiales bacterium]